MDLGKLCTKVASEQGSWLTIMDFDGATPVGMEIRVLGPDSKEAIRIADDDERMALKRFADAAGGSKVKPSQDTETSEERAIRKACALSKDWRATDGKDIIINGAAFPYSETNARWLFENSPHIRNQVISFYVDRSNFTTPGSQPSAPLSGEN